METRKKAPRPVRRGGETNRDPDTEAKRDTDPEAKSETEGETDAPKEIGGVRLVRDGQELAALVAALRAGGRFALDTEFIPENRLHPELGLIQVAAPGVEAVVDPLAVKDLGPLFALISDPRILKVVHSGKHDFDIFYRLASAVPANVFDTQIAAAVIGHGKKAQIALRTLVAGFMGRELSKQEQMSNWLQRPLTVRQVEYAIADVRYLLPLRAKLRQRAKALGRLDWLVEEMKPLTDESNYLMPPVEDCYRSLDNTGFTPSQRGSLRELAAWRERRARAANRPRGWILKDAAVRELARRQPRDRKELLQPYHAAAGAPGRPPKGDPKNLQHTRAVLSRQADAVLEALAAGAERPVSFSGTGKQERRAAPESVALLLETWLKLRAAEHGVAPELLATQEELRAVAAAYPDQPDNLRPLTGYRRRILGDDLLLILSGQAVIQVGAGRRSADGRPPIRLARLGLLGRFALRDYRENR